MTLQLPAVFGAFRYEFAMQVRRLTVWITFLVFTALFFLLLDQGQSALTTYLPYLVAHYPLNTVVAEWAFSVNTYLPICLGCLLAGRLPRDRRTRVDELLTALPATLGARLTGKYLGATCATVVPMFLIYDVGIVYIAALSHSLLALPLSLAAFAVIALPGALFVGAFSIALPAILWVPLYQFLFIGYWFWTVLWFHANIPNLARTLVSPIGLYMAMGIYGLNESSDTQHPIHITGTLGQGLASIAVLVGIAAMVMFALDRYLAWLQARR